MEFEAKIAKVNKQNSFENTCLAGKMTGSRVTVTLDSFENPAPDLSTAASAVDF